MKNKPTQLKAGLSMKGRYKIKKFKAGTKDLISETEWISNLIVSSNTYGKNIIARQLSGDTTYAIAIDSAAIGTDNTAASTSDTALGASVLSGIAVADTEVANNVLTIEFFIADGDLANGTYNEFGLFANSRMMARSVISGGYSKSSGEDTLVAYEITV